MTGNRESRNEPSTLDRDVMGSGRWSLLELEEFRVDSVIGVHGLVGGGFEVSEDLSLVHVQGARTTTETDSLRSELPAVADLAPQHAVVLCGIGGIEPLAAQSCGNQRKKGVKIMGNF